jgi:hypothetical protein
VLRRRRRASGGRTDITRLYRNPAQLQVLAGLLAGSPRPLRLLVYGVADGAEAVSLLAAIAPDADDDVLVLGRDLDEGLLAAARAGGYLPGHAPDGLPPAALAVLEPRAGSGWIVRAEQRPRLRYEVGDVGAAGEGATGDFDLVTCQNTLVTFDPDRIGPAVAGLAANVRPGGLLALGGGPLDHVPAAAVALGLEPILDDVEAVHESWEVQRRFWENADPPCWALEPFDADHGDGPVRYATLFRCPA